MNGAGPPQQTLIAAETAPNSADMLANATKPIRATETRITPFGYTYTMALNIKDAETERLASEIAALTGESKTGAVRKALSERKQRLLLARTGTARGDRMVSVLEQRLWPRLPTGVRGSELSKEQEEAILGFGAKGV